MAHSVDEGLIVPPRIAPTQVVIVPIFKTDAERSRVLEAAARLSAEWKSTLRFKVDDREQYTRGYKFNEWEIKGSPLRVAIGPKDNEKGTVGIARRDQPGKQGKSFVPQEGLKQRLESLLAEIQQALYDRALLFRKEHTFQASNYDELKQGAEKGFVHAYWAGTREDEDKIKDETRATIRLLPLDHPRTPGKDVYTVKPAPNVAVSA